LGGAIFVRAGTLNLVNDTFSNNAATGGAGGGNGATAGQGKGGALFIMSGATAVATGSLTFSGNSAADAGSTSTDNADVYGILQTNQAPRITVPGAQTAFENVDLAIGGISVSDPASNNLTVTLQVSNGRLTLGTTAGLTTVLGNGGASVTLAGSIADLNAALASLVYRGAHNFGGDDTLSLTASDGSLSTGASVAIHVESRFEQAEDLEALVTALYNAGVLNKGQANSLNAKLELKGNGGDAGKVQAFLNEVDALVQAGILTQSQADALLGPGNILLLSVTQG
jgi:hypothetical protein